MQRQLEEEKQATQLKIEESKRQFRDFNVNKLALTVNSILSRKQRQAKTQGFDAMQLYSCKLKLIVDKSKKQKVFREKAQVWRGWRMAIE